MNITPNGAAVLLALRAASALRREPGPLTPDGHRHFFTLAELEAEGRFHDTGTDMAALSRAARGLRKHGYVAARTQFTVTRWTITGEGVLALLKIEAQAGVTEAVAAQLEWQQARYDLSLAEKRLQVTEDQYRAALDGLRRPIPDLVEEALAR